MLGTPYTSFTDDQGQYQFRFDMALVDNCRTQYVRVSADGYESRLLVHGGRTKNPKRGRGAAPGGARSLGRAAAS
jgi:hypothetical protein